jgi:hypothetical protein
MRDRNYHGLVLSQSSDLTNGTDELCIVQGFSSLVCMLHHNPANPAAYKLV